MSGSACGIRLALLTDTYAPHASGVARALEQLVHAVRARGGVAMVWSVDDPAADPDDDVRRFPTRTVWTHPRLRIARPVTAAVTRELARFRPTVVHSATMLGVGVAGREAAARLAVPFVTSCHMRFAEVVRSLHLGAMSAPGWAYLRWFHGSALRTWVPTREARQELVGRGFANVEVWDPTHEATLRDYQALAARGHAVAAPADRVQRAPWGVVADPAVVRPREVRGEA